MESHYCRKSSSRMYLDSHLNMTIMYEMYLEKCKAENVSKPVKKQIYINIFKGEFNLAFHKPKKDTCKICEKFKLSSPEEKKKLELNYQKHIEAKNLARQSKAADKEKSRNNPSFQCFTFDLEAVLYSPSLKVGIWYYARKFATYNFTLHDSASGKGYCYVWFEINGKRGADEIGTAIFKHLSSLPPETKEVVFYSDSCGGQNRNRYIASLLLYAVKTLENLKSIQLNFLETGHTQMEVDSMHSCIERAKKKGLIFSPEEYFTIIRMASRNQPYEVYTMTYKDIYDLKALKKNLIQGRLSTVSWLKIKQVRVEKENPNVIFVKTSYDPEEEFLALEATAPQTSGRKKKVKKNPGKPLLVPKYKAPIPISSAKKRDLVSLCEQMVIPKNHHQFYLDLPCNDAVKDRLPEPDEEEDEEEIEEEEEDGRDTD